LVAFRDLTYLGHNSGLCYFSPLKSYLILDSKESGKKIVAMGLDGEFEPLVTQGINEPYQMEGATNYLKSFKSTVFLNQKQSFIVYKNLGTCAQESEILSEVHKVDLREKEEITTFYVLGQKHLLFITNKFYVAILDLTQSSITDSFQAESNWEIFTSTVCSRGKNLLLSCSRKGFVFAKFQREIIWFRIKQKKIIHMHSFTPTNANTFLDMGVIYPKALDIPVLVVAESKKTYRSYMLHKSKGFKELKHNLKSLNNPKAGFSSVAIGVIKDILVLIDSKCNVFQIKYI